MYQNRKLVVSKFYGFYLLSTNLFKTESFVINLLLLLLANKRGLRQDLAQGALIKWEGRE
jgi:hypothetical protein